MYKKIIMTLMIIFAASNAEAGTQKYYLDDTKRVEGVISGTEANRIKVEGDRIAEVIGLSESFALENDERVGQIFIKAGIGAPKSAIFSVVTEKGKTQDFKLKVKSKLDGQIIVLQNEGLELIKNGRVIGSKHARHDEIVEFIKRGRELNADSKVKGYRDGDLEITLLTVKKSGKYSLEVWKLNNKRSGALVLPEKQFIGSRNTAAVMLEKRELGEGEETKLYKVIYHD